MGKIVDCSDANQDNEDNFSPQVDGDPVDTTLHRSEQQKEVDQNTNGINDGVCDKLIAS